MLFVRNARSLRHVVPYDRMSEILRMPYYRRMRYLRILRYLLPRT